MIDLMMNSDEEELVQAVQNILAREFSQEELLRGSVDETPIGDMLRKFAGLGWFSLMVPEENGGAGLTLADQVLLLRELGRELVPGPIVPMVLAASVALAAQQRDLVADIVEGKLTAGLIEFLPNSDMAILWDSCDVELYVVVNMNEHTVSLVRAEEVAKGAREQSIDPYTRVRYLAASDIPAPIATAGDASDKIIAYGRILSAALLTGICERTCADSAEYAKTRTQFGKPIGTFQAVKHRCADMALRAESAWSQTIVAALRVSTAGVGSSDWDVVSAKLIAGNAAIVNARDNIQNHGGNGYTARNTAHLHLKRAHVLQQSFGDPRYLASMLLKGDASW